MITNLTQEQLETFRRDGFVVVPGVLGAEEVTRLREAAYAEASAAGMQAKDTRHGHGFALPGDLSAHPRLCHLVTDPRLVSIAEQLVGAPPVYFRDSAVGIGGTERGWHKDNRNSDRYDVTTPDWDGDYPLVRMAIYCEDHVDHSGGLAVRVGSHRPDETRRQRLARAFWSRVSRVRKGPHVKMLSTGMLAGGKPVHVASGPGDVVAWNMRITHSGHTVRLKGLPGLKLPPFIENRLPAALVRGEQQERVAVFVTYAAETAHMTRFIEWLKTRAYFAPRTKDRPMCPQVVAAAEAGGSLTVLDPWQDVRSPVA